MIFQAQCSATPADVRYEQLGRLRLFTGAFSAAPYRAPACWAPAAVCGMASWEPVHEPNSHAGVLYQLLGRGCDPGCDRARMYTMDATDAPARPMYNMAIQE
mmetsp:Transcript_8424/g.25492  ORF Transcript_8424/g.25492 Transcript_8424/m.25492 type:complete len:102 (-) Transcript_8424:15-320(-)